MDPKIHDKLPTHVFNHGWQAFAKCSCGQTFIGLDDIHRQPAIDQAEASLMEHIAEATSDLDPLNHYLH